MSIWMSEDQIIKLFKNNPTKEEIIILGQLNAVPPKAILRILVKHGLVKGKEAVVRDKIDKIVGLAQSGLPIPTIAERYGCSDKTIRRVLEKEGVYQDILKAQREKKAREKAGITPKTAQEIVEMYQSGEKIGHIAKLYGTTDYQVKKILKGE